MTKLSLADLVVSGRRVFMRVDFNVPMAEGEISDDWRIRATMPSIEHVIQSGGRLILASHLGRPKGTHDLRLSLGPIRQRLEHLTGHAVAFAPDCVGPDAGARKHSNSEGARRKSI